MIFFSPNVYSAMNINLGLKSSNAEFDSYIMTHFDNVWEQNIKNYKNWIESSVWRELITRFYHKFQLHDKQIKSIKDSYLILESNILITIDYESFSVQGDVFPKWMDNNKDFGIFLYDEFSEENGLLSWEFYDSNGNLFRFDGVSKIS